MVVKPLDAFVRDRVRPLLKEKGFSKSGHTFRAVAPNGDIALIQLRGWRLMEYEIEFHVNAGVLPLPWIEYLKHFRSGNVDGSDADALWWNRLRSPFPGPRSSFSSTDLWQFNPDDDQRIDVFLSKLAALADRLCSLTDRQNLIAAVRDPATRVQELRHSREHSLALLLVDEGPSRELEGVLRGLESENPDDRVASWVRARLAGT